MSWQDSPAYLKGQVGERIVDRWLEEQGLVPYHPVANAAHPFDRLVASKDKRSIIVVEVKAKPARNKYPDTGIDYRHYQDYQHIWAKHHIPVFIAFVDEKKRQVYGQLLSILEQRRVEDGRHYPLRYANGKPDIIYFPLSAMRQIADLTDDQVEALSLLRRSQHDATVIA